MPCHVIPACTVSQSWHLGRDGCGFLLAYTHSTESWSMKSWIPEGYEVSGACSLGMSKSSWQVSMPLTAGMQWWSLVSYGWQVAQCVGLGQYSRPVWGCWSSCTPDLCCFIFKMAWAPRYICACPGNVCGVSRGSSSKIP